MQNDELLFIKTDNRNDKSVNSQVLIYKKEEVFFVDDLFSIFFPVSIDFMREE